MTDKKAVTRFFQIKMIPPPLWNACDFVLQISFTVEHIASKMSTAADFLCRLETNPNEKNIFRIRKDVPTQPIEANIESTRIAQEDQVSFHTDDIDLPSKNSYGWRNKISAMLYTWKHPS